MTCTSLTSISDVKCNLACSCFILPNHQMCVGRNALLIENAKSCWQSNQPSAGNELAHPLPTQVPISQHPVPYINAFEATCKYQLSYCLLRPWNARLFHTSIPLPRLPLNGLFVWDSGPHARFFPAHRSVCELAIHGCLSLPTIEPVERGTDASEYTHTHT